MGRRVWDRIHIGWVVVLVMVASVAAARTGAGKNGRRGGRVRWGLFVVLFRVSAVVVLGVIM